MPTTALDRVRDALERAGSRLQGGGPQYEARCPAHEDRAPSLGVLATETRVLLYCQAGCDTRDAVLPALGLTYTDLYEADERDRHRGHLATYSYGSMTVHRRSTATSPKAFLRAGDTKSRALYRAERLTGPFANAAVPILLVEGEEDVHAVEAVGAIATTAPGGAAGIRTADLSPLRGRHVVVVADRDTAGQTWRAEAARRLAGIADTVEHRAPATGKDISDHLAAGHTLNDLTDVSLTAEPPPTRHRGDRGDEEPEARRLRITRASQIPMRATRWFWADHITVDDHQVEARLLPVGGLSLLAGREGIGKSTVAYRLAAQVTRGTLPGSFYGRPMKVIIAAAEDDWGATIVPRLAANGADLDLVGRVDVVADGVIDGLMLPVDTAALVDACSADDVALLLLDPLMSVIGAQLDTHRDHSVRLALDPIAALAAQAGVAALGLIHVNKTSSGDLLTRIMASRAFAAVARSVLFAAAIRDTDTGDETLMLGHAKSNLGPKAPLTLPYSIHGVHVGNDPDDPSLPVYGSRIAWGDAIGRTIEDIVIESETPVEKNTAVEAAADFLRSFLKGKGQVSSKDVKTAAEQEGIGQATLKRALSRAGVVIHNTLTFPRSSYWELPAERGDRREPTEPTEPTALTEPTEPTAHTQSPHLDSSQSAQPSQPPVGSTTVSQLDTPTPPAETQDPDSSWLSRSISPRARARETDHTPSPTDWADRLYGHGA